MRLFFRSSINESSGEIRLQFPMLTEPGKDVEGSVLYRNSCKFAMTLFQRYSSFCTGKFGPAAKLLWPIRICFFLEENGYHQTNITVFYTTFVFHFDLTRIFLTRTHKCCPRLDAPPSFQLLRARRFNRDFFFGNNRSVEPTRE